MSESIFNGIRLLTMHQFLEGIWGNQITVLNGRNEMDGENEVGSSVGMKESRRRRGRGGENRKELNELTGRKKTGGNYL